MAYDKEEKIYWIKQKYYLSEKGRLGESLDDEQPCDENVLLKGIIKQSDNIEDLLDELKIKIDAGKYNL